MTTIIDAPRSNRKEWTSSPPERKLLTVREAAKLLQVSERSLYNFTQRGDLTAVRMGRSVRYDPADLWQFVETSKVSGETFTEGSTANGIDR